MFLIGCSRGDPRVTIHGTVALDGNPISTGQVIFLPHDSTLPAAGATLKDGLFTVLVHKGLHRVKVEAYAEERISPSSSESLGPNALPEADIVYRSLIPPRYNEKSTLSLDVQSAKDKPAFDLTSDR